MQASGSHVGKDGYEREKAGRHLRGIRGHMGQGRHEWERLGRHLEAMWGKMAMRGRSLRSIWKISGNHVGLDRHKWEKSERHLKHLRGMWASVRHVGFCDYGWEKY